MSFDNSLPVGLVGAEAVDLLTFSCQRTGFMVLMRKLYRVSKKKTRFMSHKKVTIASVFKI